MISYLQKPIWCIFFYQIYNKLYFAAIQIKIHVMKTKKLEKKTVFLFKKNNLSNLTKEQMRNINGGDGEGEISTGQGCIGQKTTIVTMND